MPDQRYLFTEDDRNRPIWCRTEITQTPISDLKSYANNSRSLSERSLARLAESIAEFGLVVPALIDRDNTVITGHGRIEAARCLKLKTIPTNRADHLTEAQVKVYGTPLWTNPEGAATARGQDEVLRNSSPSVGAAVEPMPILNVRRQFASASLDQNSRCTGP